MLSISNICRRLCLFAAVSAALIQPAGATGEIHCEATDGSGAWINVGIGHIPFLSVLSAQAFDGNSTWATGEGGDFLPIHFAQGFSDEDEMRIDFTGDDFLDIMVSLRLHSATAGSSSANAGILIFRDGPVVPVSCIAG